MPDGVGYVRIIWVRRPSGSMGSLVIISNRGFHPWLLRGLILSGSLTYYKFVKQTSSRIMTTKWSNFSITTGETRGQINHDRKWQPRRALNYGGKKQNPKNKKRTCYRLLLRTTLRDYTQSPRWFLRLTVLLSPDGVYPTLAIRLHLHHSYLFLLQFHRVDFW